MGQIYALYKENYIPTVGGVNPSEIETGLAIVNDWKLCKMDKEVFSKFSEFKLYPVNDNIANGIILLSQEHYTGIQADELTPDMHMEQELTETEKLLAREAESFLNKLDLKFATRAKIRAFKDFKDDLADTKLLMELVFAFLAEEYTLLSSNEQAASEYGQLLDVINTVNDSDLRINKENIDLKIKQIIDDEEMISRIIKTHYQDKLK